MDRTRTFFFLATGDYRQGDQRQQEQISKGFTFVHIDWWFFYSKEHISFYLKLNVGDFDGLNQALYAISLRFLTNGSDKP